MPSTLELARLRGLGQEGPLLDPYGQPLDYESPGDYVDPAEQRMLFPQGLQDPGHEGGLEQTALASRVRDRLGGPPPDTGAIPQPTAEEAALRGRGTNAGTAEAASAAPRPGATVWGMHDPAAFAKADQAQRQSAALGSLGHSVGTLVRLAVLAGVGGAAASGAGAGAASGTGAGASSAAG